MGNQSNFRVKNMQYVEKFILYRSNKIVCDSEYGLTLYSYKSNDCTGDGEKVHAVDLLIKRGANVGLQPHETLLVIFGGGGY